MSSEIYVIGASMTPFGKFMERSIKSLVAEAVSGALSDAGAAVSDVDAAFHSNTTQSIMEGQHLIRGQIALRGLGFNGIPIVNVENACASGSTAFHQAVMQLRAGAAEVALAVGVEKMYDDDRVKSSAVFDGGWDVHEKDNVARSLAAIGEGVETPPGRGNGVRSPFIELYASLAKGHMKMFGTTERHLATVAAKNHHHSTMNPLSQYRDDMTVEEVLAARLISWPLTLPMCSPISDGAAAVLLCRKEALSRFPRAKPVKVLASVLASGSDRAWSDMDRHMCRLAALKAYDQAGIGPRIFPLRRSMTPPLLQRSSRPRTWDFARSGRVAGSPNAARRPSAAASRSILPEALNQKGIESAPPASPRFSTNSPLNSAATQGPARRCPARDLPIAEKRRFPWCGRGVGGHHHSRRTIGDRQSCFQANFADV